jgi:hypothetical protein
MGRCGRCSHDRGASMAACVGGGWAKVGDAAMAGMYTWQPELGWVSRGGRCRHARDVAMPAWIGDGWAEVGDAAMTAWCGIGGRRWQMQPCQGCSHDRGAAMTGVQPWLPGLGVDVHRWKMRSWQGCSRGSVGVGGWTEVGDTAMPGGATMATWFGGGCTYMGDAAMVGM